MAPVITARSRRSTTNFGAIGIDSLAKQNALNFRQKMESCCVPLPARLTA